MIHLARFKGFGGSLSEAAVNMISHPGKTLLVLFSPEQKLRTLVTTFGGFGFLAPLTPQLWLVALPNLMERFLADKREMWGLGFHYSVVLVSLSAWGTVRVLAAFRDLASSVAARLGRVEAERVAGGFDVAAGVFLVLCTLGASALSATAPELGSLYKPYFSKPAQVPINQRALEVVPDDAKVVAQNHFLPHLAFRQYVWQPQDRFFAKADWAVLNPVESPWPHNKGHVVRWTRRLLDDAGWTLVFSEGTTAVFQRGGGAAVEATPQLLRAVKR
jgi:hypothetical protein